MFCILGSPPLKWHYKFLAGVNTMNTNQPTYDDILRLFQETNVLMKELFVSQKETDRKFQDTDRKFQETSREIKENSREIKAVNEETSREIKAVNESIGRLGNQWGQIGLILQ